MTSLLYYSIFSDLTENEKHKIDERVAKDGEAVYLFVRNLPLNGKRKMRLLRLLFS